VGTSTASLVAEGITGTVGYAIGWKLRVHQSEKFLLSGTLGLGNQGATFVNLLAWAEGIVEGTPVPLVRSRQSLRGSGGLHAAWGVSRRFGLLGAIEVRHGESFDGTGDNDWSSDARLAVSYDAAPDLGVPLGLALTGGRYELDTTGTAEGGIWFWSVRLAAQNRRDFTVGLDFMTQYYDSYYQGSQVNLPQISIDMRYFY
jgi:hypothetical protein